MPRFYVYLSQYVEEIAEMTVEAPTEKEARDIALHSAPMANWQDGTDSLETEATMVKDAAGKIVWQR